MLHETHKRLFWCVIPTFVCLPMALLKLNHEQRVWCKCIYFVLCFVIDIHANFASTAW